MGRQGKGNTRISGLVYEEGQLTIQCVRVACQSGGELIRSPWLNEDGVNAAGADCCS